MSRVQELSMVDSEKTLPSLDSTRIYFHSLLFSSLQNTSTLGLRPSFFPFISPPPQSLQLHLLLQHLSHLVSFLSSHSLPLAVSSFLLLRNAPFYLFRASRLLCISVCPQGFCLFRKIPFLDNRLPVPQTSLCSPCSTSLHPS